MPKPIHRSALSPFWTTNDKKTVQLYQGDVRKVLRQLKAKSVHTVVTSPPYWGLRDYGTGTWEGGDVECDHLKSNDTRVGVKQTSNRGTNQLGFSHSCTKCGAKRVDEQLGSEKTPQEFVDNMVEVFAEVHRVLRDDGTLWLNLGDSYNANQGSGFNASQYGESYRPGGAQRRKELAANGLVKPSKAGLDPGNLVGIPWRVALALQEWGWVLRQDIVWAKPSPMPESVRNRCTKAHEYVFLLTKSQKYFCDMEAIKEDGGGYITGGAMNYTGVNGREMLGQNKEDSYLTRNKRSVWNVDPLDVLAFLQEKHPDVWKEFVDREKLDVWKVASQGYAGAHFATFPPKLIEPMILAGTSEKGCCSDCGAPWKRVTEEENLKRDRPNDFVKRTGEKGTGNSAPNSAAGVKVKTVGWEPTCECFLENGCCKECGTSWETEKIPPVGKNWNAQKAREGKLLTQGQSKKDRQDDQNRLSQNSRPTKQRKMPCNCFLSSTVPCTVLDPFIGSGTTVCVALEHGRRGVGIDLSETYLAQNAIPRIEGQLMKRPSTAHLAGRVAKVVNSGTELELT